MKVYCLFLCCVLLTTAASFSLHEDENDNVVAMDAQAQAECNCENGNCVTDKFGHSKCVCKRGFALQDKFTCKPCDCGSLGKCIFILELSEDGTAQYQKKCVCDVGKAEKDGVCVDCFCGDNSACDYDFGERRCYCLEGYSEKDGVCTECDCGFNGECAYENGNKICECDEGYLELDGICEECDCGDNGNCSFENGQKTCQCQPGFSVNDGICEQCDCGFNGKCTYENGDKKCECDEGYLELNGICEECDCGDHGTCSFENGQKTCKCQPGFSVNNGICEPCDCGSNSVNCVLVDGIKQCECEDRYADRYGTCEECYCGNYTTSCNFSDNQKTCNCLEGYVQKGEMCELGCSAQQPCQHGGFCKGGFCFCLNGTRGEFCDVIDACSTLCPNERDITCDYDVGSQKAYCKCLDSNRRYNPNMKQCRRTCDEDRSCKNQGKCTGTPQDKFCDCLEGTTGDFCEEIPVCKGVDCGPDAYCVFNASTKSADCVCKDSGLYYDTAKGKCRKICETDKECLNGGKCSSKGSNKFCDCLPGTQGDICETIDDCATGRIKCKGEETYCAYDVKTQKASCQCKDKHKQYDPLSGKCRQFCEKDKECFNGGKCSGKGSNKFCDCLPGTQGDRCEIIDDCATGRIKCKGEGAYCVYDAKKQKAFCQCKDRHKEYDPLKGKCRRDCDKDKDCLNGGKCRHSGWSWNKFCECLRGTQGDRCEIIDDCASGHLRCRGDRVFCDFDEKNQKAFCKCKDKDNEYDYRSGRCKRKHGHRHHSSEESSSEEWDFI